MTDPHPSAALIELLDGIPVGFAASHAGVSVYSNKVSRALGEFPAGTREATVDGRTFRLQHLSVPIAGRPFEVELSYDVTEQRQLEEDLFRRAYYDVLTGLPNRDLMERSVDTLVQAGDAEQSFALAFFDLDGFKTINDYFGHAVGDTLLLKIAQRLSGQLRPTDMLARVGGDEFVLLLSPVVSIEALTADVEMFLQRLKGPYFIEGHEIFASASIGISLHPADGATYHTLCANADRAMYRGKGGNKGRAHFFNPTVDRAASERAKTEQRLRLAIRDQQLICAYQPKVDFRSNELVGVEVLLRWRDEEGLIQPPGDFVNLAVELGLMDEITHLVLAETIGSIDRLNEAFGHTATISLNVAARQADDKVFMRSLCDAINTTGYAKRFMLELTEEAFLSRSRFQTEVLPMVREIGARVSIDDFGVGYSSLAALADITADEIKVDRSFITAIHQRPRSQSILKAIESLAHALNMSIIVEGVETAEELLYLQAATRIRLAQGFFFAKPMFLDDVMQARALAKSSTRTPAAARVSQSRVAGSLG